MNRRTQTQRIQDRLFSLNKESNKMCKRNNYQRMYKRRGNHGSWVGPCEIYPIYGDNRSKGYIPEIKEFLAHARLRKTIRKAKERAPKGKMAGRNEMSVTMMKLSRDSLAYMLAAIWTKWERHRYLPKILQTATVVQIHKRRAQEDPAIYRTIAFMLHAEN